MGFLQRLLRKSSTKSGNITILGPSKAGKTTLIKFLETGEPQNEEMLSTLGIDFRKNTIQIENWQLRLIDVGGQKVYQQAFWDFAVEQASALIYVIDATIKPEIHKEQFNLQLAQYQYALDIVDHETPVLLLLNKQDLTELDPINPETFANYYPLENLTNRSVALMPTSAKYGDGVLQAMQWLIQRMNE